MAGESVGKSLQRSATTRQRPQHWDSANKWNTCDVFGPKCSREWRANWLMIKICLGGGRAYTIPHEQQQQWKQLCSGTVTMTNHLTKCTLTHAALLSGAWRSWAVIFIISLQSQTSKRLKEFPQSWTACYRLRQEGRYRYESLMRNEQNEHYSTNYSAAWTHYITSISSLLHPSVTRASTHPFFCI